MTTKPQDQRDIEAREALSAAPTVSDLRSYARAIRMIEDNQGAANRDCIEAASTMEWAALQIEGLQHQLHEAVMSTHRQAMCIHQCAAAIGSDTSATIDGLPLAVKRVVEAARPAPAALPKRYFPDFDAREMKESQFGAYVRYEVSSEFPCVKSPCDGHCRDCYKASQNAAPEALGAAKGELSDAEIEEFVAPLIQEHLSGYARHYVTYNDGRSNDRVTSDMRNLTRAILAKSKEQA